MKQIAVLGALLVVAVATAAAQPITKQVNYRQAECSRQADTKDFGSHDYQRHRFLMRCAANLPDLDVYDHE